MSNQCLTFAIGDVHGRYDLLLRATGAITAYAGGRQSRTVMLGDYVDRGPHSDMVVDWLIRRQAEPESELTCLKGNHEAMMADALIHGRSLNLWLDNGGEETLESYQGSPPAEHLRWMDALPLKIEDGQRVFVHAGLKPGAALSDQEEEWLLWSREKFLRAGDAWGVHVVHGHTYRWEEKPDPWEPELLPHRTNLDTAAFMSGVLTVGVFDDSRPGPIALLRATIDGASIQEVSSK